MTDTQLIYQIRQTPSMNRSWNRLSTAGKTRVLYLANGDDFMLDTILDDVLEEEREAANNGANNVT